MQVQDVMTLPEEFQDIANRMQIFDRINSAVDNYLNVGAVYGYESADALECLYRGMRNTFWNGVYLVIQKELMEKDDNEGQN